MTDYRKAVSAVLCRLLLLLSAACAPSVAQDMVAFPGAKHVRKVQSKVRLALSADARNVYRSWHRYKVLVDAEMNETGRIQCAEPLSGIGTYWGPALQAINEHKQEIWNGRPGQVVIEFDDPTFENDHHFLWRRNPEEPCRGDERYDVLLESGNLALLHDQIEGALTCYTAALRVNPASIAANYGLGIACRQKDMDAMAAYLFERVIQASPQSLEARIALARTYGALGRVKEEEETLRKLLAAEMPLIMRERALHALVNILDGQDRVVEAAEAKAQLVQVMNELHWRDSETVSSWSLRNARSGRSLGRDRAGLASPRCLRANLVLGSRGTSP